MGDKKGLLRVLHMPFQCHHAPKKRSDSTTPHYIALFFFGGQLGGYIIPPLRHDLYSNSNRVSCTWRLRDSWRVIPQRGSPHLMSSLAIERKCSLGWTLLWRSSYGGTVNHVNQENWHWYLRQNWFKVPQTSRETLNLKMMVSKTHLRKRAGPIFRLNLRFQYSIVIDWVIFSKIPGGKCWPKAPGIKLHYWFPNWLDSLPIKSSWCKIH